MADGDVNVEGFAGSHDHAGAGAETTLTIATVTDRHYDLIVNVVVSDDTTTDRNGWLLHLLVENDNGTLALTSSTFNTHDPVTSGYTVSTTTSGTNVLVQVAAAAGAWSAASARGVSVELNITI